MTDITLNHNMERQRYELLVDGKVAGFAEYTPRGDVVCLTHTEIDAGHEGMGFGSQLATLTLDRLREDGRRVVPRCAFIAGYIERHPEYRELLATDAE